jgi:hypothetical protein
LLAEVNPIHRRHERTCFQASRWQKLKLLPDKNVGYSFHCFRDFGAVLAENKIGWAVWGWDEGFRLRRRTVDGKPVVDTVVAGALGLKVG